MATDEERAAIMAEYMNQVNKDNDEGDDEEEEFQGGYFDDDDDDDLNGSDAYGEDDDDDDDDSVNDAKEEKEENYAILQGNLTINDEGKLIYSGTWSMKQQNNGATDSTNDGKDNDSSSKKKKKKTKFKLKSKRIVQKKPNGDDGSCFTLTSPLSSEGKPRSILFDGFFTTDETDTIEPYRKIKERDIEMTFSAYCEESTSARIKPATTNSDDKDEEKTHTKLMKKKFRVNGKGCNDFGAFTIEGIFDPSIKDSSSADGESGTDHQEKGKRKDVGTTTVDTSIPLICHKKYEVAESQSNEHKKRKRSRGYDSEEDYDFGDEGDEGANYSELIGLHEEAELSVEELKKKYYGGSSNDDGDKEKDAGGGDNNNGGKNSSVHKRAKTDDDDDDDDGCGF